MKTLICKNRQCAINIAMNTNGVSREIAERYTDSELKEVLRLLKIKAKFQEDKKMKTLIKVVAENTGYLFYAVVIAGIIFRIIEKIINFLL